MDFSKVLKVRVNCNLKTRERIYPAGEISAPFADDLLAELASGSGMVEVISEVVEAFPAEVPPPPVLTESESDEKRVLIAQAESLGIVIDKRWGAKKIKAELFRLTGRDAAISDVVFDDV